MQNGVTKVLPGLTKQQHLLKLYMDAGSIASSLPELFIRQPD